MLGMLQIITYLLCVYLVFKAVEIFQIALASDGKCRVPARVIGVIALGAGIMLAFYFTNAIDQHAMSVSESMKHLR
jgi:hypothetical protein